jgi:hypothetical protein
MQETDQLTCLVHEFGMGSWAAMINSLQHDDLIQRRSAVSSLTAHASRHVEYSATHPAMMRTSAASPIIGVQEITSHQ